VFERHHSQPTGRHAYDRYVNAKRYAVGGSGPEWFLGRAAWSPPAGWWTWLAAVLLAGACLLALAVRDYDEIGG
jgi:hypothetical protein